MRFKKIIESQLLPDSVVAAFTNLADLQRGKPEFAMLRVQHYYGGGVLSPVVEHVGDLTHRMTEHADRGEYLEQIVFDKVRRALHYLQHQYGFEREMKENIRNNNIDKEELSRLLLVYAKEHKKLPVYNAAHYHGREAAVAVGKQLWETAIHHLLKLRSMIEQGSYKQIVSSYNIDSNGRLLQYKERIEEDVDDDEEDEENRVLLTKTMADKIDDEFISILRKNYKNFFSYFTEPVLYRGTEEYAIRIINPTASKRKSAYTSNEYTVLLSNLPEWSAFPKRNKSIIGTSDAYRANEYGSVHSLILPNNFRLGVCSSGDMWESFPYMASKLGVRESYLRNTIGGSFTNYLSMLLGKRANRQTTLEELKRGIDEIEQKIKNNTLENTDRGRVNLLKDYLISNINENSPPGTAFNLIRDLLHPKKNGFELVTSLMEVDDIISREPEVWTDSTCLLIPARQGTYANLRKKVLGIE